jgi:hypothetical protein
VHGIPLQDRPQVPRPGDQDLVGDLSADGAHPTPVSLAGARFRPELRGRRSGPRAKRG